jgi:hypothetical protein
LNKKNVIMALMASAILPILFMWVYNRLLYSPVEIQNPDGSVTQTAQWVGLSFASYCAAAVIVFILYIAFLFILNKLRK